MTEIEQTREYVENVQRYLEMLGAAWKLIITGGGEGYREKPKRVQLDNGDIRIKFDERGGKWQIEAVAAVNPEWKLGEITAVVSREPSVVATNILKRLMPGANAAFACYRARMQDMRAIAEAVGKPSLYKNGETEFLIAGSENQREIAVKGDFPGFSIDASEPFDVDIDIHGITTKRAVSLMFRIRDWLAEEPEVLVTAPAVGEGADD